MKYYVLENFNMSSVHNQLTWASNSKMCLRRGNLLATRYIWWKAECLWNIRWQHSSLAHPLRNTGNSGFWRRTPIEHFYHRCHFRRKKRLQAHMPLLATIVKSVYDHNVFELFPYLFIFIYVRVSVGMLKRSAAHRLYDMCKSEFGDA